jgi:hypothetical protein
MRFNPFQRATVIALAWCLIGLGIETQPDRARRAPAHQRNHFASARPPIDGKQKNDTSTSIKQR